MNMKSAVFCTVIVLVPHFTMKSDCTIEYCEYLRLMKNLELIYDFTNEDIAILESEEQSLMVGLLRRKACNKFIEELGEEARMMPGKYFNPYITTMMEKFKEAAEYEKEADCWILAAVALPLESVLFKSSTL